MFASLVLPPALCVPHTLYQALPTLAGALRDAGVATRLHDLNLKAADRLLSEGSVASLLADARGYAAALEAGGDSRAALRTTRALDAAEPGLRAGARRLRDLRDPERFFAPGVFKDAFYGVVASLNFVYQLNPTVSPHRPTFFEDLWEAQRVESWSPLLGLYERFVAEVLADRPAFVGVTLAFPEQSVEGLRFLRRLRAAAPGLPIAVGGPLVAENADLWLREGRIFDVVDAVCYGDGEHAIVEFAEFVAGRRGLDSVRNTAWRDRDGVVRRNTAAPTPTPSDEIPRPEFDGFDWSIALTPRPVWPMMASRGCYWAKCAFCSIGWRKDFRASGYDGVRRDVVDLARRGARWIQMQDSSVPPAVAARLARAVQEEGLDVTWVGGMKPDACFLDADYCRDLFRGGCRSLLMGIESATQRTLDRMRKGYRIADLPRMLGNLRDAGISVEALWFTGFPGETRAEAIETPRWLARHRALFGMSAFVGDYQLHPDTIVAERPGDFGLEPAGIENDAIRYVAREGMQPEELRRLESMFSVIDNRSLAVTAYHLPHLAERGMDLTDVTTPHVTPPEATSFCTEFPPAPPERAEDVAPTGRRAYFHEDFGFRSALERAFPKIVAEWRAIPRSARVVWDEDGAVDGSWEIVGLYGAGRRVDAHCAAAPIAAAILDRIPGIYTAGFSIVGPRSRLPRHCGEDRTMLRCHLAIEIPPGSGFEVDGLRRDWVEGKTLVFDDTLPHSAWNDGDREKVVLLIDWRLDARLAAGLVASPRQLARDRAYYESLFPEWHGVNAQASGARNPEGASPKGEAPPAPSLR